MQLDSGSFTTLKLPVSDINSNNRMIMFHPTCLELGSMELVFLGHGLMHNIFVAPILTYYSAIWLTLCSITELEGGINAQILNTGQHFIYILGMKSEDNMVFQWLHYPEHLVKIEIDAHYLNKLIPYEGI
ncbi:hypothetical protein ACJX0J_032210 [Zea mays]